MSEQQVDLNILSRSPGGGGGGGTSSAIPRPASRWRTRVMLPAGVLASFAGVLIYAARDTLLPATEVRVAPVVSKSVAGGSGSVSFQAAGWIEADPYSVYVSALTDGVVKDVPVLEGQRVEAGAIVATLIDDEAKLALSKAEAELHQRKAEVLTAESMLAAAQQNWDYPIERDRAIVVAESMLSQSKAELARQEAQIEIDQARADELRDQLKRYEELSSVKAVADAQRIQTGLQLKTQEATIKFSQKNLAVLTAKVQQQDAELHAARENLRLRVTEKRELDAAKAAVEQAHAAVDMALAARDEAQLRLKRMEIRAPSAGVVMERLTEPGAKLMLSGNEMNSARVLKLYDPNKLQVRVDVPLAEAAHVGVGQDALIVSEVLRDTTFKGKVTRILHEADIQKNTLQVKVAIEQPTPELKPEMLARVQFVATAQNSTEKPRERLFVPENALQRDGNSKMQVWIVDKGRHVATQRSVTTGTAKIDGWIEVTEGVQPGDAVITGDTSRLRDGERVRAVGEADSERGGNHGSH
jgi:HlyD family secretion protein